MKITIDINSDEAFALCTLGIKDIEEQVVQYRNVQGKLLSKLDVCLSVCRYVEKDPKNSYDDVETKIKILKEKVDDMFYDESRMLFWIHHPVTETLLIKCIANDLHNSENMELLHSSLNLLCKKVSKILD